MQSVVGVEPDRVEVIDLATGAREWLWADLLEDGPVEVGSVPVDRDPLDPVDEIVQALRVVDRQMAVVLRAWAQAGPSDGLPARRHVALSADVTGVDVGMVDRAVQVLAGMPRTWAAFDDGSLSWSQLRGIVLQARRLSAVQRGVLDEALAGAVVQGLVRGEPDRIVELAGDLVARLDAAGQREREAADERAQGIVLQPDLWRGGEIHGYLAEELYAVVGEALDAAADAPVAEGAAPLTDDEGRRVPAAALAPTGRRAQLAEALGRVCEAFLAGGGPLGSCTCGTAGGCACGGDQADRAALDADLDGADLAANLGGVDPQGADVDDAGPDDPGLDGAGLDDAGLDEVGRGDEAGPDGRDGEGRGGASRPGRASGHAPGCAAGTWRRARPRVLLVTTLAELMDADLGVGSVASRLLVRRGSGRRRITRALSRHLSEDAEIVPIFTDADHMPVAVGDAHDPIPIAVRRALLARDQGCRAPGCSTPPGWCDVHHVVPREQGGATVIENLALLCRPHHTALARHGWVMRLDGDGTLHTTIGRRTYVTRSRLRPPP
jgi:hypothetical protein